MCCCCVLRVALLVLLLHVLYDWGDVCKNHDSHGQVVEPERDIHHPKNLVEHVLEQVAPSPSVQLLPDVRGAVLDFLRLVEPQMHCRQELPAAKFLLL